jgi:hypothetical protein
MKAYGGSGCIDPRLSKVADSWKRGSASGSGRFTSGERDSGFQCTRSLVGLRFGLDNVKTILDTTGTRTRDHSRFLCLKPVAIPTELPDTTTYPADSRLFQCGVWGSENGGYVELWHLGVAPWPIGNTLHLNRGFCLFLAWLPQWRRKLCVPPKRRMAFNGLFRLYLFAMNCVRFPHLVKIGRERFVTS